MHRRSGVCVRGDRLAELETILGRVRMSTPLVAVSGVFGMGYRNLAGSLKGVGAVVSKSITLEPRSGNPEPRIIETPAGMLNSIGLQNDGVDTFLRRQLGELLMLEVPIIVSVAGATVSDYVRCATRLAESRYIDALELNVSCPNVAQGGIAFGCDPRSLFELVTEVRRAVPDAMLIVKLTPNVSDIAMPAKAAIDGGANALSLINTVRGMVIDLDSRKPKLRSGVGGLSGQCIHPIAVYMVHRCYATCAKANGVPIIGMGGVSSGREAVEMLLAGATCVGVGTAMFTGPSRGGLTRKRKESVFATIDSFLRRYVQHTGVKSVADLVGLAHAD